MFDVSAPMSVSGKCQIVSNVNNDVDDYGYLDFELDEEYKRSGEYDDGNEEDEEEEEEEDDDEEEEEDDDDDEEEFYEDRNSFRKNKKEINFVQQTIQKNAKEFEEKKGLYQKMGNKSSRVQMPSTGVHHLYASGYGAPMGNVYTIPEEDEIDSEDNEKAFQGGRRASVSHQQQQQTVHQQSVRRYSVVEGKNVSHQLPKICFSSASGGLFKPGESSSTPRMLPSTSTAAASTVTRLSNSMNCSNSALIDPSSASRQRSCRSNSEPFLQTIKPLKRGN